MSKQIISIVLLIFLSAVLFVTPLFSQETPFMIYGPEDESGSTPEGSWYSFDYISALCVNSQNTVFFWSAHSLASPNATSTSHHLYYLDAQNNPQEITVYNQYLDYLYIAPVSDGVEFLRKHHIAPSVTECFWEHYTVDNSVSYSDTLTITAGNLYKIRQLNEDCFLLQFYEGENELHIYCVDNEMNLLWSRYLPASIFQSFENDTLYQILGIEPIDSTHFLVIVGYDVLNMIYPDRIMMFSSNPDEQPTTYSFPSYHGYYDCYQTFPVKQAGTCLVSYLNTDDNSDTILKCTLTGIEEVTSINEPGQNIDITQFAVTGDSTGILVVYSLGSDLKLSKKSYDGEPIWEQTWDNVTLSNFGYTHTSDLVDITDSGNYVLGLFGQGYYVLAKVMADGQHVVANEDDILPIVALKLSAYPNPFASNVNIVLQSKSNAPVKAEVYNIKGQLIKKLGNSKTLTWDGTDTNNQPVSNGIYFIKAEQDGKAVTSKVIRIR